MCYSALQDYFITIGLLLQQIFKSANSYYLKLSKKLSIRFSFFNYFSFNVSIFRCCKRLLNAKANSVLQIVLFIVLF